MRFAFSEAKKFIEDMIYEGVAVGGEICRLPSEDEEYLRTALEAISIADKALGPCGLCDNARLNDDLTDENDFSALSVGTSKKEYRLMLCSGYGKPLRIEAEKWYDNFGWHKIAEYFPKCCPNCGRKIVEYKKEESKKDENRNE